MTNPANKSTSRASIDERANQANSARNKLWQSARVLRQFTATDLATTAECTVAYAQRYIRFMRLAGYVQTIRAPYSGPTGGVGRYRLIRNPGPHPLRYQARTHSVIDPNTQEEHKL